jgi:hypothetical protein
MVCTEPSTFRKKTNLFRGAKVLQVLVAGGGAESGGPRLVGADDEVGRSVKGIPPQVPLVHLTFAQNKAKKEEKR